MAIGGVVIGTVVGFLGARMKGFFFSTATRFITDKYNKIKNKYKAERAIKDLKIRNTKIPVGEVHYDFANALHPETGEKIYNFSYIASDYVDLKKALGSETSDTLVGYVMKAAEECTVDKPIVQQHLHKVVPKDDLENVKELISTLLSEYVSTLVNEARDLSQSQIAQGYSTPKEERIALLVVDKSGSVDQLSLRIFTERENANIEKDNIRFFYKGNWVKDGDKLPSGKRFKSSKFRTEQAIKDAIIDEPWLKNDYVFLKDLDYTVSPDISHQANEFEKGRYSSNNDGARIIRFDRAISKASEHTPLTLIKGVQTPFAEASEKGHLDTFDLDSLPTFANPDHDASGTHPQI